MRKLQHYILFLPFAVALAAAHEHHDEAALDPANQLKPIDTVLWLHIYCQIAVWGLIYPIGMIFGLTKSRWHVPTQLTATLLSVAGAQLAHHHGGRAFPHHAHGTFAGYLLYTSFIQAGIGVYLKVHVMEGTTIRRLVLGGHSILGRLFPVIGYAQMVLGAIAGLGFCSGGHLGQCLAHFIMGSSFVAYGIIILIFSMHGAPWLEKHGVSQEFLDSSVIMTWGIVITFTMHGFLEPAHGWSHKDMQHTALGVLFWSGGALGLWMGRRRKRNIWPALVISLTGFAMSGHEQATILSTNIHSIFGYTLMLAGICRIIEICFVLKEQHEAPADSTGSRSSATQRQPEIKAWQHTTPFLLMVGGLQFMAATEEQIDVARGIGMDHVTYIIILFCMALVIYLWVNLLIALYHNSGRNAPSLSSSSSKEVQYTHLNGDRADSIELGQRNSNRVFDADEDDDADNSYWDGETLGETAKEIHVK